MGLLMMCEFKREANSDWEIGIMIDEGRKGYLDRYGNPLSEIWEANSRLDFSIDLAPILTFHQNDLEKWQAKLKSDREKAAAWRAEQEKKKLEESPAMKEEQERIINGKTPQIKRPAVCIVEGCLNKANAAKGLCHKHYGRKRRHGNTDDPERINKGKTCSVEGCEKDAREKGMCVRHARRVETHGDPHTVTKPYTYDGQECLIHGCSDRPTSHGMCNKHYANYKYHRGVSVDSVEEYIVKKSEGEI